MKLHSLLKNQVYFCHNFNYYLEEDLQNSNSPQTLSGIPKAKTVTIETEPEKIETMKMNNKKINAFFNLSENSNNLYIRIYIV